MGSLVVAPLRLVPRGHRVEGCQGGSGGALRGGRERERERVRKG